MALTPDIEALFYSIADDLELNSSQPLLYPCNSGRAEWICRKWLEFKRREAIQSIFYLDQNDPSYAYGFYHRIVAKPHEQGVVFSYEENPHLSAAMVILLAAFREAPFTFNGPNAAGQLARDRVALQKFYPEEMRVKLENLDITRISHTEAVARPRPEVKPVDPNVKIIQSRRLFPPEPLDT